MIQLAERSTEHHTENDVPVTARQGAEHHRCHNEPGVPPQPPVQTFTLRVVIAYQRHFHPPFKRGQ